MNIQELDWLRSYSSKLDPELRSRLITCYRTASQLPCFLQRLYHFIQNKIYRFPVIIQLATVRDHEAVKELRTSLSQYNKAIDDLEIINGFSTSLSLKAIKKLTNHSLVTKIYLDQEIRTLLNIAAPTIQAPSLWEKKYSGKGVAIAVLDTGIYPHPDFLQPQNRILAFKDFVKNKNTPYDDNGHGTHCAGAAAGNGYSSSGKYTAPAFEAKIIALKILNKMGIGKSSTAIKGIEWVLANRKKYNIKIITLSLGYKTTVSYREDPLCQALEKAWQAGLVVCTAAGNDGPEPKTINSPGIHPALITVGAFDDHDTITTTDDTVADFSSRGPTLDGLTKPDFLFPGSNIISARAKDSYLDKMPDNKAIDNWYLSFSGTSMATPICAGVIAQLLEANPALTPPEIKEMLQQSCTKVGTVDANTQGSGFINLAAVNFHAITP